MDFGIAVNFAGAGLQDPRAAAFGDSQHVDRAEHAGLDRLDRIELVVPGGGRTSHVVDLVDLQKDRQRDVVPNQLKVRFAQQMRDVRLLAGEEIVQADHVVAHRDQPFAEVGAQKTGAAGDKNSLDHGLGLEGLRGWISKGWFDRNRADRTFAAIAIRRPREGRRRLGVKGQLCGIDLAIVDQWCVTRRRRSRRSRGDRVAEIGH